jgi:hypothetical protein
MLTTVGFRSNGTPARLPMAWTIGVLIGRNLEMRAAETPVLITATIAASSLSRL